MKIKDLPIDLEVGNILYTRKGTEHHHYVVLKNNQGKVSLVSYSNSNSWDYLDIYTSKNTEYDVIRVYNRIGTYALTEDKELLYNSDTDIKDGDLVVCEDCLGKVVQIFVFKEWVNRKELEASVYCGIDTSDSEYIPFSGSVYITRKANHADMDTFYLYLTENNLEYRTEQHSITKIVKPIFSVGDKIIRKHRYGKDYPAQVLKTENQTYYCKGMTMPYSAQDNWEIYDKKKDPKYNKELQVGDVVVVRNSRFSKWKLDLYSYTTIENTENVYVCAGGNYKQCLPYTSETKQLVGTIISQYNGK